MSYVGNYLTIGNMRELEIVAELRSRLPKIVPLEDLRWEPEKRNDDAVAKARIKGVRIALEFEILSRPNLASVRDAIDRMPVRRRGGKRLPILVAPALSAEARQLCKERGQAYLDLSGNVWIDFGPVLIEKEVSKNLFPHEAKNRSPFADKASLLLRYLLDKRDHAGRVLEIAEGAKLSPGYVSKLVRVAEKLNYLAIQSDGLCRLRNIREMLADWSASYRWQKNQFEPFFVLPGRIGDLGQALRKALAGRADYALSLHAGNNAVEPYAQSDVWHLYAEGNELAKDLQRRLHLEPVARDAGNVIIMQPYYRHSALYGVRDVNGFRVVSDLQLYLDLRHYHARGFEAAEAILLRRLARAWKLKNG